MTSATVTTISITITTIVTGTNGALDADGDGV
jgi:hypothetical protein